MNQSSKIEQQNDRIIKEITSKFLDNILKIKQNKIILKDEKTIDLDQKFSIRKWLQDNTELDQTFSRRKYVELSKEIDWELRKQIETLQQEQIQKKIKDMTTRHNEVLKHIKKIMHI